MASKMRSQLARSKSLTSARETTTVLTTVQTIRAHSIDKQREKRVDDYGEKKEDHQKKGVNYENGNEVVQEDNKVSNEEEDQEENYVIGNIIEKGDEKQEDVTNGSDEKEGQTQEGVTKRSDEEEGQNEEDVVKGKDEKEG